MGLFELGFVAAASLVLGFFLGTRALDRRREDARQFADRLDEVVK